MRVFVCIKQVPDTTQVKINPETNTLIREGVASIINPFDMYAIEEGIRVKEKHDCTVTVVSMGPPQVVEALREAISLGADEAYLLSDRAFAGADTLATAYTLAAGIRKLGGADLIILGRQAIDGDTGQVGPGLAENMGIVHITDVRKIENIDGATITVERLLEEGFVRLRTQLPVLLTVVKEINEPRLPSLKGKLRAKKATVEILKVEDLDIDQERIGLSGSPTQVMRIFTPPRPDRGKIFQGDVRDAVGDLLQELAAAEIPIRKNVKGGGHGAD